MATSQDDARHSPDGQNQPDQNSSSSLDLTNQVAGDSNSAEDQVVTLEELARALSISDDQNESFQMLLAKEEKSEIPTSNVLQKKQYAHYNSSVTVQRAFKSRKLFPSSWVVSEITVQQTVRKPAAGESPIDYDNYQLYGPNVLETEATMEGIKYIFPGNIQKCLDFNEIKSVNKQPFRITTKNPQREFYALFDGLSINDTLDGVENPKTASLVKPVRSGVASNTGQSQNVPKMNISGVEAADNVQSNSIGNVQNEDSKSALPDKHYYKYVTSTELIISSVNIISRARETVGDGTLEQITHKIHVSRMAFLRSDEIIKKALEHCKNTKHLFPCKFCDKSFKDKAALSAHLKTHEWSSEYKCEICGKVFPFQSSLSKHKLIHSGGLDSANTSIQPSERPRVVMQLSTCPFCFKNFITKSLLSQHMKYHEWSGTYKCDICSKDFNFQSALHKHMLLHERSVFVSKPKPKQVSELLSCELCNKSYKSKTLLALHMKSHECYNCGLTFKYQDGLLEHKSQCQANAPGVTTKDVGRRRSENQLLSCKFCDESFKNKAVLFEHLKSHQWSSLYKCDICGKGYNVQSSLLRHKLVHSDNDEPLENNLSKADLTCPSCREYFPTELLLNEHTKSQHNMVISGTITIVSAPKWSTEPKSPSFPFWDHETSPT